MAQDFFTITNLAALFSINIKSKASTIHSPFTLVVQTNTEVGIQGLAFCRYANLQNKLLEDLGCI